MGFFDGSFPEGICTRITAVPADGSAAMWLLGSSGYSAQVGGHLGLPFAFAHHFSARFTEPALELYPSWLEFAAAGPPAGAPGGALTRQYAMVTVCGGRRGHRRGGGCGSRLLPGLSSARLRAGRPGAAGHPGGGAARTRTPPQEWAAIEAFTGLARGRRPRHHRARASWDLLERTRPQELVVLTNVGDPAARRR